MVCNLMLLYTKNDSKIYYSKNALYLRVNEKYKISNREYSSFLEF